MPASTRVRLSDYRALATLVGECRDLGDDVGSWHRHWAASLAGRVGADLVLTGEVAGLLAGRMDTLGVVEWGWENGFDRTAWLQALNRISAEPAGVQLTARYTAVAAQGYGAAVPRPELIADREWYRLPEYDQMYRPIGLKHSVMCHRPIPGAETMIGAAICRGGGLDFTARETGIVREAYALLAPLVGGPLARFNEPSPAALQPRTRQVLKCLLEGDGDKQVAARLEISPFTVNGHTKVIYAHFGVQGRAELLARWVRRGWGSRAAWADELPADGRL